MRQILNYPIGSVWQYRRAKRGTIGFRMWIWRIADRIANAKKR
jgi:hypothetical protein